MQQYKAIIIGTSLAGKTTLVRYLREKSNIPVQEIDEEIAELNGGEWPRDLEYKNTVLVPPIKAKVLSAENIVFFTNAYYFTPTDLQIAHEKGFKIVQLSINREEMEKRNKYRMKNEGYDDQSQWFDGMLQYQKEINDKELVDKVIKTNKPVKEVVGELISFLQL